MDTHILSMNQILKNIEKVEKEQGVNALQFDVKRIAEAVRALLLKESCEG